MNGQQAVRLIDRLLDQKQHRKLNDLESIVMLHTWEGKTYQKIADQLSYELDYIKQVACRLWRSLSKLLGENISKTNIKSVLERYQESISVTDHPASSEPTDISHFYEQETIIKSLETWIINDRCQSIVFSNSERTDKAPHSLQLNQQVQGKIESLLWQSSNQPITPDILVNEILSALTVNNPGDNPINCLIINCYF